MSSRPNVNQPLRPSLLDQLIDSDPQVRVETPRTPAQVLRELKRSVRRDIEDLLNTRWRNTEIPPELSRLEDSLINYGIPDFTAADMDAARNPDVLLFAIADCLRRFEPRLRNVRLQQVEPGETVSRTFLFRIEGTLCVEPLEEFVRYDSSFETTTCTIQLAGGGS